MSGSVKEIIKLEKTSLSDFTLCRAELLPKLLKQLEESLARFLRFCGNSLIACADYVGMTGRLNKNAYSTMDLSARRSAQMGIEMNLYNMLVSATLERESQNAIIWDKAKQINYKEFLELVNAIIFKIKDRGINNSAIGIALKRTPLLIASMFAVVASGNYYVPIDLSIPQKRRQYILNNSNASALLLDEDVKLDYDDNKTIYISLKDKSGCIRECIKDEETQERMAYCIYTSGSTGNPKGVMVKEDSLVEFIHNFSHAVSIADCKRVLCATTHSFDIFFVESIFALIKGMTVVLTGETDGNNPKRLLDIINEYDIDLIQMTPSRIRMICHYDPEMKNFDKLKCIFVGGELFPEEILDKLKKVSSARIYNLYGPTEATIWCSVCELTNRENITIGRPIPNVNFAIWDTELQQLSESRRGELLIEGNCLADSYYGDLQKTNNSFIWLHNKRYFKTGDAIIKEEFEYQILGRIDNQVKYRGYRIELEEIEICARKCSKVMQCIAYPVVRDGVVRRISLYYTTIESVDCQEEIKYILNKNLPEYMVPSEFIQVESFFYTNTGKIDRKRISDLTIKENRIKNELKSELQKDVKALIWKITEVCDDFSEDVRLDDIIDSLNFVQLVVEIESKYHIIIADEILVTRSNITFAEFVDLLRQQIS